MGLDMGLDPVELVMWAEETFDITIPNEEAERLHTVGKLYRYILDRVEVGDSSSCLTAAAFYRFRRVLVETFGIDRDTIRPGTRLDDLILLSDRKARWQQIDQALGMKLPGLCRPPEVVGALNRLFLFSMSLPIIATLAIQPLTSNKAVAVSATLGLVLAGILSNVVGWIVTKPRAIEFPPNCQTVRGMVYTLVGEDLWACPSRPQRWNCGEVWEAIRAIIVSRHGVRPEDVHAGARFVQDLGI